MLVSNTYILFPEYVLQEGGFLMKVEVCNGLCVVDSTREHLREVGHEDIEARGKRGVKVRVEKEEVS